MIYIVEVHRRREDVSKLFPPFRTNAVWNGTHHFPRGTKVLVECNGIHAYAEVLDSLYLEDTADATILMVLPSGVGPSLEYDEPLKIIDTEEYLYARTTTKTTLIHVCFASSSKAYAYLTTGLVDLGDKVLVKALGRETEATVISLGGAPEWKGPIKCILKNITKELQTDMNFNKVNEKGLTCGLSTAGLIIVDVAFHLSTEPLKVNTLIEVEDGDIVVFKGRDGHLRVGTVLKVWPPVGPGVPITNYEDSHGFILDKVDMSVFEAYETKAIRTAQLKEHLDMKKKQFQDMELLRLIAASDPETSKLLDEYIALSTNKPVEVQK